MEQRPPVEDVEDYAQNIVFWNPTAERLLGHKAGDVIGRKCFDVIAGGDYLGHPFCSRFKLAEIIVGARYIYEDALCLADMF